jgi:hypothetical protein
LGRWIFPIVIVAVSFVVVLQVCQPKTQAKHNATTQNRIFVNKAQRRTIGDRGSFKLINNFLFFLEVANGPFYSSPWTDKACSLSVYCLGPAGPILFVVLYPKKIVVNIIFIGIGSSQF